MNDTSDAIVVGAGLAGLVATCELVAAGRRVILLDQESEAYIGGQAWWSFGGLFLIDSPEQRRMKIRDSRDLAWQDWLGAAGFDREEDHWPRRWAQAYVDFAAGEKRSWLRSLGMKWFPIVGWAERGGGLATGHGNSVPRFHVTWGTGPGVVEPFVRRVADAVRKGRVVLKGRHRVSALRHAGGAVTGVEGDILEPTEVGRGEKSSRAVTGHFAIEAQCVVLTSGGIGGNPDLVRSSWPERLGPPPQTFVVGVPYHVDGHMLSVAEAAGARLINRDRMWHYTEGVRNHSPIWPQHGIRILPGPSSLWLDAFGRRLPPPLFPGFDTLATLAHLRRSGRDWSWFIATEAIVDREFALSGSEQNPDLTGKSWRLVLRRVLKGQEPVERFKRNGEDFIVKGSLEHLVAAMNERAGEALLDAPSVRAEVEARDREITNEFSKDAQITAIRGARMYRGDKLIRVAKPHRLLDPKSGPLIAVRLWTLTRKTLGGLETDLQGRVLGSNGEPIGGLYAAGEAAGFGGGGMHGYRSLEGTFLGGCIFSGRAAGRGAASAIA